MADHKDKVSVRAKKLEMKTAGECMVVDLRLPFSGDRQEAQYKNIIYPQFNKLRADSFPMPSTMWMQGLSYTHPLRSISVKLKLKAHNGDRINVLCSAGEISSTGIFLMLPCQLGIDPGSTIEMELFLEEDTEAASIQGRTRKIAQVGNEDSVKYVLEVDFKKISVPAEKQIEAFIQSYQVNDHRQMPA